MNIQPGIIPDAMRNCTENSVGKRRKKTEQVKGNYIANQNKLSVKCYVKRPVC